MTTSHGMIKARRLRIPLLLLILCCIGLAAAAPVAAAPAQHNDQTCVPSKRVQRWVDERQIERNGFNRNVIGAQASLQIAGQRPNTYLSLQVAAGPSAQYTASRITEIESGLPIAERIKCWQPTERRDVLIEYTLRFQQPLVQQGMTENMLLWNAPLPSSAISEPPIPLTAFGVSRNNGRYVAVIAQDLVLATFTGLVKQIPMPAWLNAAEWHCVRVRISDTRARVEVAQGTHGYTVVAEADLLRRPDPMAFEFSVDNEVVPGVYAPVTLSDGVDIRSFHIRTVRSSQ